MSQTVKERQLERSKSGRGLNLFISASHQFASQVVGVQLSIANLLAISVSAASVVAGCVTVTALKYPSNYILWGAAGLIGIGLAILIEGMTLGALIRIRLSNRKIREIEERLESEQGQIPFWHLWERFDFHRKKQYATRTYRRSRLQSIPIAIIGSIASAIAGGLFYHTVLAGLGQWESLGVAALFPFIVTCTFISSELFKEIQEEAIKEAFTGGGLSEAAIKEETRRQLLLSAHQDLMNDLNDPEVQAELKTLRVGILKEVVTGLLKREGEPEQTKAIAIQQTTIVEEKEEKMPLPLPLLQQIEQPVARAAAEETLSKQESQPPVENEGLKEASGPILLEKERVDYQSEQQSQPDEREMKTSESEAQRDLLGLSMQFLDERPQKVDNWTDLDDEDLAAYLGLKTLPVARYWRIKALETWQSLGQENKKNTEPLEEAKAKKREDNRERIVSYVTDHPGAMPQEIAEALQLSVRTVQRHLTVQQNGRDNRIQARLAVMRENVTESKQFFNEEEEWYQNN